MIERCLDQSLNTKFIQLKQLMKKINEYSKLSDLLCEINNKADMHRIDALDRSKVDRAEIFEVANSIK